MLVSLFSNSASFLRLLIESFIYLSVNKTYKNEKIWVFGAIRGEKYMDNSAYLFEFIHNNSDIKAIWISKNREVIRNLRAKGYSAYYEYTEDALYYASHAKVAFITHRANRNKADLPFYAFSKETKIVQLWHGIPLKKIAFDDTIFSFKENEKSLRYRLKKNIKKKCFPFLEFVNKPSMVIALSYETQKIFTQAFRIETHKVKITGYPRNDILFLKSNLVNNKKKIIYMPTFRGKVAESPDILSLFDFDVEKMDTFLEEKNLILDIKLHPFNKPAKKSLELLEKAKNINLIKIDDIYSSLNEYSILITDYSSIYFDFLLLNRPLIFTPFDKEKYTEENREFYFKYESVTPGPKANNWSSVIEYIREYLRNETFYKSEREKIRDRFHRYKDGNNSQRVYQVVLESIYE